MTEPHIHAELEGRVALVTGGGRGIGRGISLALAAAGATVAVNYRVDVEAASATASDIEAAGGRARIYQASVDCWENDVAMVDAIAAELGPVDILVNNSGIGTSGTTVADTDVAEFDQMIRVLAVGPFYLSKLVIPAMRERPRGDIVMISSIATSQMFALRTAYNMGKAALEALALTLAKEEQANGIRVNTIAPGLVVSEMGDSFAQKTYGMAKATDMDRIKPFGRVARPRDIGEAVCFLVSDRAAMVTGQRLVIDGGGIINVAADNSSDPPKEQK